MLCLIEEFKKKAIWIMYFHVSRKTVCYIIFPLYISCYWEYKTYFVRFYQNKLYRLNRFILPQILTSFSTVSWQFLWQLHNKLLKLTLLKYLPQSVITRLCKWVKVLSYRSREQNRFLQENNHIYRNLINVCSCLPIDK